MKMKKFISALIILSLLLSLTVPAMASGNYVWPLIGHTTITSNFGYRNDPFIGEWKGHSGTDIGAPYGTPVYASSSGTLTIGYNGCTHNYAGQCGCGYTYGNFVYIDDDYGMRVYYAHLTSITASAGRVEQGQQIGTVGSTGNSTGAHLHFEMRTGTSSSTRVNPLNYVSSSNQIGSVSPTFATLSIGKESYNINENVTFTLNADNNAKYTLAIYKGDTRIDTIEVRENTYTRTFVESGSYSAYMTAYNDAGYKDSNWIGWEIKPPEPPSNISFSTNKTQYSVGETVKFSCNATNANGYTIAIYKDDNRVYQGDIPSSFSKTFTKKGNYSAYISAWNSYGLIDSKRIYFTVYDTAPINCTLTVNKSTIYSGNKIIFTANADYANGYTIGIYKNGERIYTGDIGSVFEKTFDDVGNYSAYVTAWNDIGLVDSKRVVFNVEALSGCKLEINKTVIRTNENITFSCQAENATGYTIGIDKDGIRICTESIEKICTKSFTEAGNYYAYVTAWNSQGISDSNSVRFVVYDTAPKSSELLIDKTSIAVGDSINFTCNSPQATGYTIGIYKNGARIFTSDIDKNFTKQFSETGEYSAYVTAWNTIGICDSKKVTFEVYNQSPTNCGIKISDNIIEEGDSVNFEFNAQYGKLYELKALLNNEYIDKFTNKVNYNTLSLDFSMPGIYELYVCAYNEYGFCESEHIQLVVYSKTGEATILNKQNGIKVIMKKPELDNNSICLFAVYEQNRLIHFEFNPISDYENYIVKDLSFGSNINYDCVKVMFWENFKALKPLCEANSTITE